MPRQSCDGFLLPQAMLATSRLRTPLLNDRAGGLSMTDPDTKELSLGSMVSKVATWIVFIAAFVLALIVGGVVLVVVLATRERSRSFRLPGFGRLRGQGSEVDH
jgi:hypothetical protein